MFTLIEVSSIAERYSRIINAPIDQLLTFGLSRDDGTPNVEISEPFYSYVANDRGIKSINRRTQDIDELLYWVFTDICFNLAVDYEFYHRNPMVDPRRMIFAYQLELINRLNRKWYSKTKKEIKEILDIAPYVDNNKDSE